MPGALLTLTLTMTMTLAAASPAGDLARARAQWQAMQLDEAAASLRKLIARRDIDRATAVDANILLGITCTELGQFKDAEAAFVAALRTDPHVQLPKGDEHDVPPRALGLFEAARLKIDPPPAPGASTEPPAPRLPWRTSSSMHVPGQPDVIDERALPQPGVVERIPPPAGPPWLLIGASAAGGAGVVLAGTGAALDIVAGPDMFDGGPGSFALLGAGMALLVAGGALAVADVATR